eukprot:CAMPEP_0172195146 /NCGR_PEP_ID=MMETSP1050-20130122/26026_1 /TAXON_ID=233186 /ORGANISM="Cryptomonas curvata, Strain CCAP979/52" /LENGTH=162 /DNA_ID=CAMNT_0012871137 /DNA_START=44 /DNA_END=529 /DNA_ORIENTATION=-
MSHNADGIFHGADPLATNCQSLSHDGETGTDLPTTSDDDRESVNSRSGNRNDRVERGASLMDELRVLLEEESSKLEASKRKPDESDPKVFRFERGASLLYDLQNEMKDDQSQTEDSANTPDKGEQTTADKRRAFAFRPGMQIMEYGEMLDGSAPAVLPAMTV